MEYGALFQSLSWLHRNIVRVPQTLGWVGDQAPEDADSKRFLHLPFPHLGDAFVCATLLTGQGVPHEALSVREFLNILGPEPDSDSDSHPGAHGVQSVLAHIQRHRTAFGIVVTVREKCLDGVFSLLMCQARSTSDVLFVSLDQCAHCHKPKSVEWCSACQRVLYCSRACQQAHFESHKAQCAEWQQWQWAET